MSTIITNSQFQRNPSKLTKSLVSKGCIVTAHGVPKMIVLPYFDKSDELMEDYYEQFEISQNQKKLKGEMVKSLESGNSDLIL